MADGESELTEGMNESKESSSESKVGNAVNKASQAKDRAKQVIDMAKKVSKKFNNGAAKIGKIIAQIASKLGPALPYVAIAAVIIFIIIGICGFLATMPGLLSGKLKSMAQGLGDWWEKGFTSAANATVNESDVIETAEYIRSMGYDLIGYGFIPANELTETDLKGKTYLSETGKYMKDGAEVAEPGSYYDIYGICYSTGGDNEGADGTFETAGSITGFLDYKKGSKDGLPDTNILRTYLIADARVFNIRNYDNENSIWSDIHDIFVKNGEDWAKGLISLYHAEEFKATKEYSKLEAGYIKIDSSVKQMEVRVGWNTNAMQFQLDGWSGRYGVSLEFLLSLHLGTMAPELVGTMSRTFDTEVQVYLGELRTDVIGWFKEDGKTEADVNWQKIYDLDKGFRPWISTSDARNIMKTCGIKSRKEGAYACEYSSEKDVLFETVEGGERYKIANYTTTDTTDYNKLITDINAGKLNNVVNRIENSGVLRDVGVDNWYAFVTDPIIYDNIDSVDWAKFERAFVGINRILNLCKDEGYGSWKDEEHPEKTFIQTYNWYKLVVTQRTKDGKPIDEWAINWGKSAQRLDGTIDSGLKEKVPFKEFINLPLKSTAEFVLCSFINSTGKRRLVVSMMVSAGDWGGIDISVIAYEEEVDPSPDEVCSDKLGSLNSVCQKCTNYVKAIRDSLDDITMQKGDKDLDWFQSDFRTYTPYIARVVDSWFRDTYFIIPEDADKAIEDVYKDKGKKNNYGTGTDQIKLTGNSIEFVEVDNEYLADTDEYWTKYETKEIDGKVYYILYVLKPDGTLDDSASAATYIRYKNDEGKDVYKNLKTGEMELVTESSLKLAKKTISEGKITDGWIKTGSVWSVYANDPIDTSGIKKPLEVNSNSPTKIKNVAEYTAEGEGIYRECFYYEMKESAAVQQEEDARRGITNPTIKRMFKVRKYYIYDGSEEKAKAIYKDWKGLLDKYDFITHYDKSGTNFYTKYHDSADEVKKEIALEYALDDLYYYNKGPLAVSGKTAEECDPRASYLIGNITINKDTLNAFSILENTHTLDADYQYRDFKELIVELDYFDKEDLSDKPEEVFEWILPEYQEKWPLRLIDKSDMYYGTLIHSNKAIDQLKVDLEIKEPEDGGTSTGDVDSKTSEVAAATGYPAGTEAIDVVSPVTGEVIGYGVYDRDNTDKIKAESIKSGVQENAKTLMDKKGLDVQEKDVGYIQIRVLDEKAINLIKANCSGNVSGTTVSEEKAWNGYYDEYQGICEGYVITIEGIELLSGIDSLEKLKSSTSTLSRYSGLKPNVTPNLADDDKEKENQEIEDAKVKMPAFKTVVDDKGETRLYITEGTIVGKTKYSNEFENYSYIRLILRDKRLSIVENVEAYFDLPEVMRGGAQSYAMGADDMNLLAHIILHEGTKGYFQGRGLTAELAENASRAIGYTIINRAKANYGGHGTTIREQVLAPGQYENSASRYGDSPSCGCTEEKINACMDIAEYCLTYDCGSITNADGVPMPSNVYGQSGYCHNLSTVWWHVDTVKNGKYDCASSKCPKSNFSGDAKKYDTYFSY